MNEIVRNLLELEPFTDNFFNELFQSIQEDDRTKHFWKIVSCFTRLENNNE